MEEVRRKKILVLLLLGECKVNFREGLFYFIELLKGGYCF